MGIVVQYTYMESSIFAKLAQWYRGSYFLGSIQCTITVLEKVRAQPSFTFSIGTVSLISSLSRSAGCGSPSPPVNGSVGEENGVAGWRMHTVTPFTGVEHAYCDPLHWGGACIP